MKTLTWAVLAVLGLGLMVLSYHDLVRGDPQAPWAFGFLCVGDGEPAKPLDVGTLVSTRLRLLPAAAQVEIMLKAVSAATAVNKSKVETRLRSKLIELPVDEMLPLTGWLREGRMPEPGKHEVLAGSQAPTGGVLSLAGKTFKVVGILQPSVALLADCYIAPADPSMAAFFPKADGDVHRARLIRLKEGSLRNRKQIEQVVEAFPPKTFSLLLPEVRPGREAFLAYLAAQALFLLGGTGLLIGLYRWLAGKVTTSWLALPLQELGAGRACSGRCIWCTSGSSSREP